MAQKAYSPIQDLDHDLPLARALGQMVVAWAYADNQLIRILSVITGMDWPMATAAYYRIPTFESRTKVLLAMLDQWKTKKYDAAALHNGVTKLSHLSKARNGWIHGSWHAVVAMKLPYGRGKTVIFDYREPIGSQTRRRPVKAADIMNHVRAVNSRRDALSQMMGDNVLVKALSAKSPGSSLGLYGLLPPTPDTTSKK